MKIILSSLLFIACTNTPNIKKDDPLALINCRKENVCEKADSVTWEKQEEIIDQFCLSAESTEKDFCEQRQLTSELKMIDSAVTDFTYEVHRPLYGTEI